MCMMYECMFTIKGTSSRNMQSAMNEWNTPSILPSKRATNYTMKLARGPLAPKIALPHQGEGEVSWDCETHELILVVDLTAKSYYKKRMAREKIDVIRVGWPNIGPGAKSTLPFPVHERTRQKMGQPTTLKTIRHVYILAAIAATAIPHAYHFSDF